MRLEEGETFTVVVDFGELNLGDGKYVFSFALFQSLNHLGETVAYDLVDRSYEFEVRGNETFNNGIFRHAATWTVERTDSVASREEIASGEAAR
jgi:hypothetical protein